MLATGIDTIEIARVAQAVERRGASFCDRIFTPREQAYCQNRPPCLAGRWAVKEAVAKALGTGIGDVAWLEIEIINDARGRPQLILHGAAARLATEQQLQRWSISLSHDQTHAVGLAVALGV